MPCYNPTRVVMSRRSGQVDWSRDWRVAGSFEDDQVVNLPCRHCVGCNQKVQREWAIRGFHESLGHVADWTEPVTQITTELPNSCVVTLTYDDDHLPPGGVLRHEDFQGFMKRLRQRKRRRWKSDRRPGPCPSPRYFMCGEYGGKTQRPHYHAVIFGETFADSYFEQSRDGQVNRMSHELDELWADEVETGSGRTKIGRATVDAFTFAGASYVAGYVAKKAIDRHLGPMAELVDRRTGETWIQPVAPEYRSMSRGLAEDWISDDRNLLRVYSEDAIRISNWRFHPPRYYDTVLSLKRPDLLQEVRENRRDGMIRAAEEWGPERCAAAERIALDALQQRRDSL